jgi:hypothetical protein
MLHNANNNINITDSHDVWYPTKSLIPGELYTIEYKITTVNGLIDKSFSY